MKVLVSSCIMGENCKYNGKNNKNEKVIEYLQGKEVVCVCPELLAGMSSPRPCAEIVDGCVYNEYGECIDSEYRKGVALALEKIKNEGIEFAILQSRSPTCGVNKIYDGTFSGRLISGQGLFAAALDKNGYKVIDVEDFLTQITSQRQEK